MSDDTQRDEKARLLLEHAENKQQLLQLRTRAARFGDVLSDVGSTLKREPEKLVFEREVTPTQYANRQKPEIERAFFDLDVIVELRDSIRKLEDRQQDLKPRLTAFGAFVACFGFGPRLFGFCSDCFLYSVSRRTISSCGTAMT